MRLFLPISWLQVLNQTFIVISDPDPVAPNQGECGSGTLTAIGTVTYGDLLYFTFGKSFKISE
jgi:hypothetical protein